MVGKHYLLLLLLGLYPLTCTPKVEEMPEEMIARVGEKTISVNEFIQRAEYAIRPAYCKLNYPIHKKIVLNSLIAEKLFALEAGEHNEMSENKNFQATMRGIREQAMRQYLFYQEASQKVAVDSSAIYKTFQVAGRTYEIAYFSFPDSILLEEIARDSLQQPDYFKKLYLRTGALGDVPRRNVAWKDDEHIAICEALFSEKLQKDEILGPIKVDDRYFMIKVNGWTDTRVITEKEIQTRWHDVGEKLHMIKATKVWDQYVGEIMLGKTLVLGEEAFRKLERIYARMYLSSQTEKRERLMHKQLGKEINKQEVDLADLDDIRDLPLYEIDGQVWTVDQFIEELRIRPLVFREKNISRKEFPKQFKLAIVDLVRDKYITEDAYKKGLDNATFVRRKVSMWQDSYLGAFARQAYLKAVGEDRSFSAHYLDIIEEKLNPYVDSLQQKYSDQIEINIEAFDRIGLTRIDMVAQQPGLPFPAMVPPFPLYTSDHRFDYGKVMDRNGTTISYIDSVEEKKM